MFSSVSTMSQASTSTSASTPTNGNIGQKDIANTIADIKVEVASGVPDKNPGDEVTYSEFWSKSPVILVFHRRYHEQLKQLGVRLVGIGLEKFGVEEFIEGKFWSGELYVDVGKKAYKALNLKAYNAFTGIAGLANPEAIAAFKESKKEGGMKGNFKGDGFQLGATFIFDQGGVLIYEHRQQNYGNQPEPKDLVALCAKQYGTPETTAKLAASASPPEKEEQKKMFVIISSIPNQIQSILISSLQLNAQFSQTAQHTSLSKCIQTQFVSQSAVEMVRNQICNMVQLSDNPRPN